MIEVLSSAPLCAVQDLGRFGSLCHGVSMSGAMDTLAVELGNLMLGNDPGCAAVEIPLFPFSARFDVDCRFAVTGAEAVLELDGRPVLPWWAMRARAGQTLTVHAPRRGARAYLVVGAGIAVPSVLGSRSTQLRGAFGGFEGRFLQQGDRLPLAPGCAEGEVDFGLEPPARSLGLMRDSMPLLRVLPAAEYLEFKPECRQAFWDAPWKISAQSNRYGYRLSGPSILPRAPLEMRSHGIVPGVIQVPHGGQPIVQMRDAQPTGGYPKFGAILECDLWRLGQCPIGSSIAFQKVGYEEALKASDAIATWRRQVAALLSLQLGIEPAASDPAVRAASTASVSAPIGVCTP